MSVHQRILAVPPPTIPPFVVRDCFSSGELNVSPWTRRMRDSDVEELCKQLAAGVTPGGCPIHTCRVADCHVAPPQIVNLVNMLGSTLRSLDLSRSPSLDDATLQNVGIACRQLNAIVLDDCIKLTSVGLVGLVESLTDLRHLSIAGCKRIDDAALQRVGACCPNLATLNMRNCTSIADVGLKAVAEACRQLLRVDVSEGPGVTNVGLVALARGAPGLRELRILRPRLSYLVSDDSLAIIGTSCPALELVDLTGCDRVSDVGIRWLASGATRLTSLTLANCRHIGDRGMLSIGTHLHELAHLDISGCKNVSDMGMRHVAEGCTRLLTLNVSGNHLLSDGRLKPVVISKRLTEPPVKPHLFKGLRADKKAEATAILLSGTEVGMPAVAKACTRITQLHMARCAAIGSGTLRALASGCGAGLTEFHLTDNTTASAESIVALLAAVGPQLRVLNLRGVAAVSVEVMKGVGAHCTHLRVLDLSACRNALDSGFQYVVLGCRHLTRLHIDDNPQLTDIACYHLAITAGRAVLPSFKATSNSSSSSGVLVAGAAGSGAAAVKGRRKVCSLQALHFRGCKMLTDTGITWILEQHRRIQELNIHGSGVTKGSLVAAVRSSDERGPCIIRVDSEWFGLFPVPRAADVTREAEYEAQWWSALRIQTAWRAFAATLFVRTLRELDVKAWLVTQLQAAFRGKRSRKATVSHRVAFFSTIAAAGLVRRLWRRAIRRRRERTLVRISTRLRRLQSIITLQRKWRRWAALLKSFARFGGGAGSPGISGVNALLAFGAPASIITLEAILAAAALSIQRVWRSSCVRVVCTRERHARNLAAYHATHAARCIQRHYRHFARGLRLRRLFRHLRATAVKVQAWVRVRLGRIRRKELVAVRWACAIRIQATVRMVLAQWLLDRLRAAHLLARQNAAILFLQRMYRFSRFRTRVMSSAHYRVQLRVATLRVQSVFRGHKARVYARWMKATQLDRLLRLSRLEVWAATKLQSWARMVAARAALRRSLQRSVLSLTHLGRGDISHLFVGDANVSYTGGSGWGALPVPAAGTGGTRFGDGSSRLDGTWAGSNIASNSWFGSGIAGVDESRATALNNTNTALQCPAGELTAQYATPEEGQHLSTCHNSGAGTTAADGTRSGAGTVDANTGNTGASSTPAVMWQLYYTEEGAPYFSNPVTGESMWAVPGQE